MIITLYSNVFFTKQAVPTACDYISSLETFAALYTMYPNTSFGAGVFTLVILVYTAFININYVAYRKENNKKN